MSSISSNQHTAVFVSPSAAGVALAGTTGAIAPENLAAGEITFMQGAGVNGPIGLAVPPTTGDFTVAFKDASGAVYLRKVNGADVIKKDSALQAAVAKVEQVQVLTIPIAVVVGDQYVLKVRVPGYGGLIGSEDEVYFYGSHTVVTADTLTTVAAGLADSLGKQLAKCPVPIITLASGAGTVTATAVAQPYEQAKWQAKPVRFDMSLVQPTEAWIGGVNSSDPHPGSGQGYQVAAREEFFAGYNTSYKNRFADWPNMVNPNLAADAAGAYSRISIVHATKYGDANQGTQRQIIECWFKE